MCALPAPSVCNRATFQALFPLYLLGEQVSDLPFDGCPLEDTCLVLSPAELAAWLPKQPQPKWPDQMPLEKFLRVLV